MKKYKIDVRDYSREILISSLFLLVTSKNMIQEGFSYFGLIITVVTVICVLGILYTKYKLLKNKHYHEEYKTEWLKLNEK